MLQRSNVCAHLEHSFYDSQLKKKIVNLEELMVKIQIESNRYSMYMPESGTHDDEKLQVFSTYQLICLPIQLQILHNFHNMEKNRL